MTPLQPQAPGSCWRGLELCKAPIDQDRALVCRLIGHHLMQVPPHHQVCRCDHVQYPYATLQAVGALADTRKQRRSHALTMISRSVDTRTAVQLLSTFPCVVYMCSRKSLHAATQLPGYA